MLLMLLSVAMLLWIPSTAGAFGYSSSVLLRRTSGAFRPTRSRRRRTLFDGVDGLTQRGFLLFSQLSSTTSTRWVVEENKDGSKKGDSHQHQRTRKRSRKKQTLLLPTVILKRTHQSKAFRNGNPLVFTRAIAKIEAPAPAILMNNHDDDVRMADLVHVSVETKPPKGGTTPKSASGGSSSAPIGFGLYNPNSLYRVRMLCNKLIHPTLYQQVYDDCCAANDDYSTSDEVVVSPEDISSVPALGRILEYHVKEAIYLRKHALGLPCDQTDTYRLIHGEGDGLSGLAVDVIANAVVVIMSSAAWCEIHKSLILQTLQDCFPENVDLVWKSTQSRLVQDGYNGPLGEETSSTAEYQSDEDHVNGEGKDDTRVVIAKENGILFQTFPYASGGQKTGVYCDQRENRYQLAQLMSCSSLDAPNGEKRVLDLCCYHGGFSLNAVIHGGALHATGVDSSPHAIETCRANAVLNHCQDRTTFVQANIEAFLRDKISAAAAAKEGNADDNDEDSSSTPFFYDVLVLDPPKLAPTHQSLEKAQRKYHALNRDALRVVNPAGGGLFLTCTCSSAMTQKEGGAHFITVIHAAALAAQRRVTLMRVSGAAPCHTTTPAAAAGPGSGAYLTAALFFVHPTSTITPAENQKAL